MRRPPQPICPTDVESGTSIEVRGTGNGDDAFAAYWKLSADAGNALVASPAGLRLSTPSQLSLRPATKVISYTRQTYEDAGSNSGIFPFPVTFDDYVYDTAAQWDSSDPTALIIARTGWFALGGFLVFSGDDDIVATTSIVVNAKRRVVAEGLRVREQDTSPPPASMITTQLFLHDGDRVQLFAEPTGTEVENQAIRQDRFLYAHFRGD